MKTSASILYNPVVLAIAFFTISQAVVWLWPALSMDDRLLWFRWTGLVASLPLILGATRITFGSSAKATFAAIGLLLAVGTWASVAQKGYYGDASPMMGWRFAFDNPASSPNQASATTPAQLTAKSTQSTLMRDPSSPWSDAKWDYRGFLGTQRNATIQGIDINPDWKTAAPKEMWRVPVGPAWSSFAIAGPYAITQEQIDADEAIVCRSLESGSTIWKAINKNVRFSETYGGEGPRATPTVFENLVYAVGAKGDLHCLELQTGETVWKRNMLADAGAKHLEWGMAGSPLVFDDLVVVCPGGKDNSVVAYDRHTGQPRWHSGSGKAAYASPQLVEFGGLQQVVHLNGPGLEGYNAASGELLWSYPWLVNGNMMTSV